MSYNTKQKDEIKKIIENEKSDFTIKQIYEKLDGKVGLTTIYRLIDKLVDEGRVAKISESEYHYLEECKHDNHFYLKCENCGKMDHVDCDCISELSSHIYNHHKFKANKDKIIINGICNICINKGVIK